MGEAFDEALRQLDRTLKLLERIDQRLAELQRTAFGTFIGVGSIVLMMFAYFAYKVFSAFSNSAASP
jgi:hypothetical protein